MSAEPVIKRTNPLTPLPPSAAVEIARRFDVAESTLMHDARNRVRRFDTPAGPVVVKRFGRPNIFRRLSGIFEGTKGEQAYDKALAMRSRGCNSPEPLLLILLDGHEYLFTAFCPDPPLEDFLFLPDNDRFIQQFVDYTFALHDKGILHRDYNRTNIRVDATPGAPAEFTLIDVNRARIFPNGQAPSRRQRLDNLHLFWDESIPFFRKVLKAYLLKLGDDSPATFSREVFLKDRRDSRRRRRKAFTYKLKDIFHIGHKHKNGR